MSLPGTYLGKVPLESAPRAHPSIIITAITSSTVLDPILDVSLHLTTSFLSRHSQPDRQQSIAISNQANREATLPTGDGAKVLRIRSRTLVLLS